MEPTRPLLERVAETFEKAYGIKVDGSAGSLLLAIALVIVVALIWPSILHVAIKVTSDTEAEAHRRSDAGSTTETLGQRVLKLADENRELRAALNRIHVRLEANERLAADLKVAMNARKEE